MKTTYDTVILSFGNNTGIEVPAENLAALGSGKRPPVRVTVAGYSYDSTVASMDGRSLVSLSKAHREAAGLAGGDEVSVTLELVTGPRSVDVPAELQTALEAAGRVAAFERLAYSRRKEFARQVADAKSDATRERRIGKILEAIV